MSLSEDVHALSRQLHPSILDDLGLVDALRSECASVARREGVAVAYRPDDVPASLPKDVALCVYRVAQEALRNVVKHAGTEEARVSLVRPGRELILTVQDRGVGFDAAEVRSREGLGLSSMEERVRLVRGNSSVDSEPGRGTTVTVRVPLVGERAMRKPRVLLADDHRILAEGVRGLLEPEFELVGIVSDGRELVEAAMRLRPDVIVADISMPSLNGIEAVAQMRQAGVPSQGGLPDHAPRRRPTHGGRWRPGRPATS